MRDMLRGFLLVGVLLVLSTATYAAFSPFGAAGLALNKQDYQAIGAASQPLLNDDSLPIGTEREWSNAKSGNHGAVKLLRRYETNWQGANLPCRQLEYTVVIKGQADPYNLLLNRCKVADGSWKIF